MRMSIVAFLALSVSACAPAGPPMPYARQASLPYAACGNMTTLRANLTGISDATPGSDAILRRLGVRCVAPYPPLSVRARY